VKIELRGEWFERDVVSELLELADEAWCLRLIALRLQRASFEGCQDSAGV